MKKDRNSFFSGYGYGPIGNVPNMMPNQTVSASNQFYAGPAYQEQNQNMNNNMYADIDSRISKLERRIGRIEARLNKLEGDSSLNYSDEYSNNNMYMV